MPEHCCNSGPDKIGGTTNCDDTRKPKQAEGYGGVEDGIVVALDLHGESSIHEIGAHCSQAQGFFCWRRSKMATSQ